jgi:hypothetical protein
MGREAQGRIVIQDRLDGTAQRLQHLAAIEIGQRHARRQLDRRAHIRQRGLVVALLAIDIAAVDIGAEHLRVEPDGHVEIGDRILRAVHGLEDQAAAEVDVGQLGREADHLVLVVERMGQIAQHPIGLAPIEKRGHE